MDTTSGQEGEDVAIYLTKRHDRMNLATEEVHKRMQQAQTHQKRWYDSKAREMKLKAGDQVLLMLPDSTRKFHRKWQGPFKVKRSLGKVNYEIIMDEGAK